MTLSMFAGYFGIFMLIILLSVIVLGILWLYIRDYDEDE